MPKSARLPRGPRRACPMLAISIAIAALLAGPAAARCIDEDSLETAAEAPAAGIAPPSPRDNLRQLVQAALDRSHQVGASKLLAEAAEDDVREAEAARRVQASVGAGLGPGGSRSLAGTETSALQVRSSLNISQLLYDGGKSERLTDWRQSLAESARHGSLSAQEQLALTTVSQALERSRWRQQVVVYGQYVRKMACLVEALETIVRADRGRASELVQARKSMQQAEIAQAQAQSQVRAIEVRLRRLVGDGLPGTAGLAASMLQVPALDELVNEVERSHDIAQLTAQAAAANRYADAVASGGKPQVSWLVSGSHAVSAGGTRGNSQNGTFSVGVAVNIPLLSPGLAPASDAARKRARAAELQRLEALEARRFRVAEVHEQTLASFDRARRVGAVLRDSQQVRNFTLQQWQQLGRRSLFDVMGAEAEHYNLRIAYVNALHDGQQLNANLLSLGRGLNEWLR